MESTDLPTNSDEAPQRPVSKAGIFGALLVGAVIGGMAVEYWMVTHGVAAPTAQTAPAADVVADLAQLKALLPTQSHTMKDVEDHWTNLWFAAEKKNWPLARFFFDQARQSVRWTTALRPVRQLPGGGTVDIKGIFTAIDMSSFATVQIAIEDEDIAAFTAAYKKAMDGCYSCHKAVGLPYLHPKVPSAAASTILNFDPVKE